MARNNYISRRYVVAGRVQGVGFRYFIQRVADMLNIDGYTRNLDDGRVEVYAVGPQEKLSELESYLWKGPRWADVRAVQTEEAPMLEYKGFHIEP